jgi:hypothetical protein
MEFCMRRLLLLLLGLVLLVVLATPARAMPEYATRVGEPCGTCHISPAGGGLRNLRGQAWVASGKPDAVPSTADALKILGLKMPEDMSIYDTAPSVVPTAAPLQAQPRNIMPLWQHLVEYEGN